MVELTEAAPAEAAKERRTKFALVERTLRALDEEIADLEGKVVDLERREQEAVTLAVRQAPTQKPYQIGGRPVKLRDEVEKTRHTLALRRTEAEKRREHFNELAREQREAAHQELLAKVRAAHTLERSAVKKLGEDFEQLLRDYVDLYCPAIEQLDALALKTPEVPPERRVDYDFACRPVVSPAFADFGALLEGLYAATCDPLAAGTRDVTNQHTARTDNERQLPRLTPDLRAVVRRPVIARVERRGASTGVHAGNAFFLPPGTH